MIRVRPPSRPRHLTRQPSAPVSQQRFRAPERRKPPRSPASPVLPPFHFPVPLPVRSGSANSFHVKPPTAPASPGPACPGAPRATRAPKPALASPCSPYPLPGSQARHPWPRPDRPRHRPDRCRQRRGWFRTLPLAIPSPRQLAGIRPAPTRMKTPQTHPAIRRRPAKPSARAPPRPVPRCQADPGVPRSGPPTVRTGPADVTDPQSVGRLWQPDRPYRSGQREPRRLAHPAAGAPHPPPGLPPRPWPP